MLTITSKVGFLNMVFPINFAHNSESRNLIPWETRDESYHNYQDGFFYGERVASTDEQHHKHHDF